MTGTTFAQSGIHGITQMRSNTFGYSKLKSYICMHMYHKHTLGPKWLMLSDNRCVCSSQQHDAGNTKKGC